MKPSGSWIELIIERIPLRVGRLSLTEMLKPKLSLETSQHTPSAHSRVEFLKSRSLTDGALSDSGTDSNTLMEFDIHFVRRNPPLASTS